MLEPVGRKSWVRASAELCAVACPLSLSATILWKTNTLSFLEYLSCFVLFFLPLRLLGLLPRQPALHYPPPCGGRREGDRTVPASSPYLWLLGLSGGGGWSLWICVLKPQVCLSKLSPFVAGEARGEGILMCPSRTVVEAERGMEQRLGQQR